MYEWKTPLHSAEAVDVSRYFYDFFVGETRMNRQNFSDPNKEYKSLIYNFPTTYTAQDLEYMELYFDPGIHK